MIRRSTDARASVGWSSMTLLAAPPMPVRARAGTRSTASRNLDEERRGRARHFGTYGLYDRRRDVMVIGSPDTGCGSVSTTPRLPLPNDGGDEDSRVQTLCAIYSPRSDDSDQVHNSSEPRSAFR